MNRFMHEGLFLILETCKVAHFLHARGTLKCLFSNQHVMRVTSVKLVFCIRELHDLTSSFSNLIMWLSVSFASARLIKQMPNQSKDF